MLWMRTPEKVYFKKGCLPVDVYKRQIHKRELYESKLYIRRISSHKRY